MTPSPDDRPKPRPPRGGNPSTRPRGGNASGRHESATTFVNPYTFVPLPGIGGDESAFRGEPIGHHRLAEGHFTGRIDVELVSRAPLLIRGVRKGEEERFPRHVFSTGVKEEGGASFPESVPFLPGSSLAGTVRSLHEVIAGGCLRVFDPDFLPGYRDPVAARGPGWTLAVVDKVNTEGRPVSVRLCSEVVWVRASLLAEKLGGAENVVTGARLAVNSVGVKVNKVGRRQIPAKETGWVSADGPDRDWVVLVTDSGARDPERPFWCAVGRLPRDSGDRTAEVTEEAWRRFCAAVAGADDVRRTRQTRRAREDEELVSAGPVLEEVRHGDWLIGYRHRAWHTLSEDQVVWAHAADAPGQVDEIALSAVWRHPGEYTAGERAPRLHPCREPDRLCPTCRVFGSADTAGGDTAGNRQKAYRGHVRFSDARPFSDIPGTRQVTLPPLGSPRPGAGQFYLERRADVRPRKGEKPLYEWGSRADTNDKTPRPLRGRKQYWLTQEHTRRPYFRTVKGLWKGELVSRGEYLEAGARFRFSVYVDGLDAAQLGALLVALSPPLLFGEGTGLAVGGGKPLGFGACVSTVVGLELADATARYTASRDVSAPSVEEAVDAFRTEVLPQVQDTWPAAKSALTLDRVDPEKVWYPPEKPLLPGELRTDDLAPGLNNFWKLSQGEQLSREERPLTTLPDATAEDQSVPVNVPVKKSSNEGERKR